MLHICFIMPLSNAVLSNVHGLRLFDVRLLVDCVYSNPNIGTRWCRSDIIHLIRTRRKAFRHNKGDGGCDAEGNPGGCLDSVM